MNSAEDLARHNDALDADLILDAVVGTGFKPPLQGPRARGAGVAAIFSKRK